MLAEKKIEDQQEERDREETDQRLRHQVGVGPNGGGDAGLAKFFLEIGGEIQRDSRAKRNLLGLVRADGLFDVSPAQGLRRLTFLVNQLERIIFVGDDLLVLEEFDEAVIGHVLETRVGAAAKENSQADEGESDGDENDTAPVKARLVSARFVFLLRIAIRLGHEIESPFLSGAKR